jgi:hypothetical protein
MLLTPTYLLVRTVGSGQAALDILLKPTTITALFNTVLLAGHPAHQ